MKLIDKDAVVAEIENRIKELQNLYKEDEEKLDFMQKTAILICVDECKAILSLFDALEVKEVDLEKSISDWLSEGLPNEEELIDYIKETAEHFFELGVKAQKGEEV